MSNKRRVLLLLAALAILTISANAVETVKITGISDPVEYNSSFNGFVPVIGAEVQKNTTVYIGRLSVNPTGVRFPWDGSDRIFWKINISRPDGTPLASDMLDLDEVGWNDTRDTSLTAYHYPFNPTSDGNIEAVGSCDLPLPSGHGGPACTTNTGFSVDANDVFANVDSIKFSWNAPPGLYNITYQLWDSPPGGIPISNNYTIQVELLRETTPPVLSDSRLTGLTFDVAENFFAQLVSNGNVTSAMTGEPLNTTEAIAIKTNVSDSESGIRYVNATIGGTTYEMALNTVTGEYESGYALIKAEYGLGEHTVTITATDNDGNVATKTLSYQTIPSIILCRKTANHESGVPWGCDDDPTTPWTDGASGFFAYIPQGYNLAYKLLAGELEPIDYTVIYYPDYSPEHYLTDKRLFLGNATAEPIGTGLLYLKNTIYLGHDIPLASDVNAKWGRGKIWLIPSSHYDRLNNTMINWDAEQYLFEEDFNMSLTVETGSVGGMTYRYTSPVIVPTPTPYIGGSSGSTGGAGVSTTEKIENIDRYETTDVSLRAGETVIITPKSDLPFYEVGVTGAANEYDVSVRIEKLKGLSSKIPQAPSGDVLSYMNVFAGSQKISGTTIKFKVPLDWASGKSVVLMKWDGKGWESLTTDEIGRTGTHVLYKASSKGFSSFAIVGQKPTVVATTPSATAATPSGTTVPTATPTPIQEVPGFTAIAVVAAIGMAAILRRGK